ncbi:MAG: hypothetical protein COA71_03170 [SAR86 cluster bacterium]|uniref:DUF1700 domain-containing protein n=1 Tax=SAR86 cluster bacterium TaxID=2030880 RepID=A0A2A5CF77_9GAMM|nr:MAG: hypothetical protein COA71_03170 [SAR86 cluster bacterium]
MGKNQLAQLSSTLLQGGVAYKHVRRFIAELRDHSVDLEQEAVRNGSDTSAARDEAMTRLGDPELLVQEMLERPELKSYGRRFPFLLVLMPVLSYILFGLILVLFVVGLVLIFHSGALEEGEIIRPSDFLIEAISVIRIDFLYLLPIILIYFLMSYAIKNHIALKYYGFGLLLLCLLSSSVYLNLIWPDPANAIRGSIDVSINLSRWDFDPGFFMRFAACVLFAVGLKQFITQRMQREFE